MTDTIKVLTKRQIQKRFLDEGNSQERVNACRKALDKGYEIILVKDDRLCDDINQILNVLIEKLDRGEVHEFIDLSRIDKKEVVIAFEKER